MNITQSKFSRDMKWLYDNGYQTILPSELYNLRSSGLKIPSKTVMIVFDDGYYSNYSLALPILKKLHMKAAIMLITSHIKTQAPLGDLSIASLSWSNVREMSKSGLIEFGSHTDDLHNPKSKGFFKIGHEQSNGIQHYRGETKENYQIRLNEDIKKSIQLIYENTECTVYSFSYPFGAYDPWSVNVLQENGIKVTFLNGNKVADISGGLYGLKRIQMKETTDISKYLRT
ncbi:MAG: polysaccharide deacetylase family protein [Clostridia bacterium]|nr:polysaccharide deacetylase family protein [Clostridia bacterium]